jgi:outer membrane protein assembly factor BamB
MYKIQANALALKTLLLIMMLLAPPPIRAQEDEWPMYRSDINRTGHSSALADPLSDPAQVATLHIVWAFPSPNRPPPQGPPIQGFLASPVVKNGIAYIGNPNGEFYAIDMKTGLLVWQYPDPAKPNDPPPLNGTCGGGKYGIGASATITNIKSEVAVIFGAPDPCKDGESNCKKADDYGNGRLWAIDAKDGHLIWKSDVVAPVSGCTTGAFPLVTPPGQPAAEYHENLRYSSPLVVVTNPPGEPGGGMVYVGNGSSENPIQIGAVKIVDLWTGKASKTYFISEKDAPIPIGGDVWNAPASDGSGIYFTTGNTRTWNGEKGTVKPDHMDVQPLVHYGLSMVRTDYTGNVKWFFQPVPFALDNDPDWDAGATIMTTDCGKLVVSVMKDGWSYAVNADTGSCFWQFPEMGFAGCKFPTTDKHIHGGDGFDVPGAAWGDEFVVATGGYALTSTVSSATSLDVNGNLHALDVCSMSKSRGTRPNVRWLISPVPNILLTNKEGTVINPVGAPTTIGGLVYLGTNLGHVMVYADPSVVPPAGKVYDDTSNCTFIKSHDPNGKVVANLSCIANLVPVPALLKDVPLPDGGDAARLRKEVVLAEGRALISTSQEDPTKQGNVYALGANTPCGSLNQSCCAPNGTCDFNLVCADGFCHPSTGSCAKCRQELTFCLNKCSSDAQCQCLCRNSQTSCFQQNSCGLPGRFENCRTVQQ